MKKEVILAIVFGLLVGLIVTGVVYWTRHRNDQDAQNSTTASRIALEPLDLEDGQVATSSPIKILQPANESVQTDKSITVAGSSLPNSFTVVFINDNETIVNTDQTGSFSASINLESGSNIISIYAVNEEGETYSDQITVVHSNKSLEEKLVSDSEVKVEPEKEK